jgi:hypothetical protein
MNTNTYTHAIKSSQNVETIFAYYNFIIDLSFMSIIHSLNIYK